MTWQNVDSDLSLAILGLLSMQPMSGYGLRKVFLTTAMKHFSASPGAIYPALRRLEAAGLIRGELEKGETLRPRRVYRVTESGLSALKEFLSRPVRQEDIIWRSGLIPLRLTFMCELLGKERTLQFLQEVWQQTEAYLKVLKEQNKAVIKQISFCARASFELGLENFRSLAQWARRTHEKLKNQ